MRHERSLPCLQDPDTGPQSVTDEYSPHPHTVLF